MIRRALLFRNLVDNIPKNIGLYSVGVMFLLLHQIPIEVAQTLLGLVSFLVSYSSVYVLNDLFDVEEDKKDERKVLRKPIAQGVVNKNEAVRIFILFLVPGLLLSFLRNLLFFGVVCSLVFINIIYSVPLTSSRQVTVPTNNPIGNQAIEGIYPKSLKHTILGPPLVLIMQILKIFLPWTINTGLMQFPVLFAVGFSLIYIVLFKGYKENMTIGASVKHEPLLFCVAILVFALSMSLYAEPMLQASILIYLLSGIAIFWNSHITDRKFLLLSPIYIFLGVIMLLYVITMI